jgi:hypothetical protein
MQPNQIKLLCTVLLTCLCTLFASNALFAQSKIAPANQPARLQARQAMIAKKAALHTNDVVTTTASPQSEQKATTVATPLQVVEPIREEEGVSTTEAVKPN